MCTICSPSVPHFAARLACLRSACLLACYLLLLLLLILYLCATPLPAACPHDHYSTQPAISRTIASAARIPSIHPSRLSLTSPSLACLLCLCLAQLSSRGALPTSPLPSRGTRRRATPCAALGNYTRTTCGTCRPRGRSRALDGSGPHNAQGKQSTSRLTSSPTVPTQASTNCQSTHSPTPSLSALPAPRTTSRRMRTVSTVSTLLLLPQTQCHSPLSLLPCMLLLLLLLLLPTSPHFTPPMY